MPPASMFFKAARLLEGLALDSFESHVYDRLSVREPMATLTDDEYGAQLVENALTRSKAAKIAMVHLCECWEFDEVRLILRVRLRDGIDME